MREIIRLIETMDTEGLAERIARFIDAHAKISGDYDPDFDAEEDRFNGPDSMMLDTARRQLLAGARPGIVHSSYTSGCYAPIGDAVGKAEHDELVAAINTLASSAES